MTPSPRSRRQQPRRRGDRRRLLPRRQGVLVLVLLATVALTVPASASHTFPDVPATSVHHDAIADIADAGVTAGCDDTRYCPSRAVTRDQMASFLSRSGGHVAADHSVTTLAASGTTLSGVPVTVALDVPGTPGGRQHAVIQGSVTVWHDGTVSGCPCEVEAFVYRARDEAQGPSSFTVLDAQPAASGTASVSLPVSWAVAVDSGRTEEFHVAVFVAGTTVAGARAEGSLQAVSVPFGTVPQR